MVAVSAVGLLGRLGSTYVTPPCCRISVLLAAPAGTEPRRRSDSGRTRKSRAASGLPWSAPAVSVSAGVEKRRR